WVRLDSTETIDYEINDQLINSKTEYKYAPTDYRGFPIHFFPGKIRKINSTDGISEQSLFYPQNYPTSTIYNEMVSRNQLNHVIESIKVSNNRQIGRTINTYGSFDGNISYKV